MNLKTFIIAISIASAATCAMAQTPQESLDSYIVALNRQCPVSFRDGWTVESFAATPESTVVTITVEGETADYLPIMAVDPELTKSTWIEGLPAYGESWNRFIELTVKEQRPFTLSLKAKDGSADARFDFKPSDFKGK